LAIGRFPCIDVIINGVEKAQFLLKQRPHRLEAGLSLESTVQPGKIGVGDDQLTEELLFMVEPPRLADESIATPSPHRWCAATDSDRVDHAACGLGRPSGAGVGYGRGRARAAERPARQDGR
jgi:hypothetical protein